MGVPCSSPKDDVAPGSDDHVKTSNTHSTFSSSSTTRLSKAPNRQRIDQSFAMSMPQVDPRRHDPEAATALVDAHNRAIETRIGLARSAVPADSEKNIVVQRINLDTYTSASLLGVEPEFANANDYERQRSQLRMREEIMTFDFPMEARASQLELRANRAVQFLRRLDKTDIFDACEPRTGWRGQKHPRFPGDHFLGNVELINRSYLFRVAQMAPKGAHLHIHFNSCLLPHVLLDSAKSMDRMFIWSNLPLVESSDYAFDRCELQFSIRSVAWEEENGNANLFKSDYQAGRGMNFKDFLAAFPREQKGDPKAWLTEKLMFMEEEAHNPCQTVSGAWAKFNGRTRMMKGLFNYEEAYRIYTQEILKDFVKDNIQYAEIRPNFMSTNQLWKNDGSCLIDNYGIMDIIVQETEKFMKEHPTEFGGLKVIYCTPRSFDNEKVKFALEQCIDFKKRWPKWIAGFDLVGEEGMGRPLRTFVPEFIWFREQCKKEGLDIPFLFHCGETLEMGDETDENLFDALLLNSRRIGHGFALARHPYVMEQMKKQNICLEVCPISNEVLGLTPRMNGHSMYNLLANNVHCTVSSDNGTLFRSTLSHDFYQVMVGKSDFTLHGWRQLIEWSLEHSCMSNDERKHTHQIWQNRWDKFLEAVVDLGNSKGGNV